MLLSLEWSETRRFRTTSSSPLRRWRRWFLEPKTILDFKMEKLWKIKVMVPKKRISCYSCGSLFNKWVEFFFVSQFKTILIADICRNSPACSSFDPTNSSQQVMNCKQPKINGDLSIWRAFKGHMWWENYFDIKFEGLELELGVSNLELEIFSGEMRGGWGVLALQVDLLL